MIFKDLKIENFRGIRKAEIDGFKRINLFVGCNNCGKTSVLEAMYTLSNFSSPRDFHRINIYRGFKRLDFESLDLNFYERNFENTISLSSNLYDNNTRSLSITPIKDNKNILSSRNLFEKIIVIDENEKNKDINSLEFSFNIHTQHSIKAKGKASITIGRLDDKSIEELADKKYHESLSSLFITPSIADPSLIQILAKLLEYKVKEPLIEMLQEIDHKISDIMINNKNEILVDIGIKKFIPINMMGDGTKRFLTTIVVLFGLADGVVFIDEIDNGLHYTSIEKLWKLIFSVSEKLNVQIFATTHSIDSLNALNKILQSEPNAEEKIICYNLMHLEDGELKAYEYDKDSFDFQLKQNIEIR